jgi:hypothetical protein
VIFHSSGCAVYFHRKKIDGIFSYFPSRCGRSSSFSGDGLRNKSNRKKDFPPESRHPVIDHLLMVIFDGIVNSVHSNFPYKAVHFINALTQNLISNYYITDFQIA